MNFSLCANMLVFAQTVINICIPMMKSSSFIAKCDWILETNQIVTLGLFHFIGLANGYTHTLPIYSAITRLG